MVSSRTKTTTVRKSNAQSRSRNTTWIWIVITAIIAIIGAVYLYINFFQTAKTAADLLPEESGLYLSFALGKKDKQSQQFRERYDLYEGKRLLGTSLQKSIRNNFSLTALNYEDDIKPWVGDEIAIGKTSNEPDAALVFFAKVKNINAAKDALVVLEGNIKGAGKKVDVTTYKNIPYTTIKLQGKKYVLTFVRGYIVAAFTEKDIERVIDVVKRSAKPLKRAAAFSTIQKETRPNALAFLYVKTSTDAGGFGGSLIPSDEGLQVKFFAQPTQSTQASQPAQASAPHAFQIAPIDASLVAETANSEQLMRAMYTIIQAVNGDAQSFDGWMKSLEEQAKTPVKDPLFQIGNAHMTIEFLSRVSTKVADLGVVFETTEVSSEAIKHLEAFLLTHARKEKEFKETSYKDHIIRYLPIDYANADINYTILDKKILVSNSKQGIQTLVDTIANERESLQGNSKAQESFAQLKKPQVNSFFFADIDALLTTVFTQTAIDEQSLLNQESPQIMRLLIQLFTHMIVVSTKSGANDLFSGTLLMK